MSELLKRFLEKAWWTLPLGVALLVLFLLLLGDMTPVGQFVYTAF